MNELNFPSLYAGKVRLYIVKITSLHREIHAASKYLNFNILRWTTRMLRQRIHNLLHGTIPPLARNFPIHFYRWRNSSGILYYDMTKRQVSASAWKTDKVIYCSFILHLEFCCIYVSTLCTLPSTCIPVVFLTFSLLEWAFGGRQ